MSFSSSAFRAPRMSRFLSCLFVLLLALPIFAVEPAPVRSAAPVQAPGYALGVDDELEITVDNHPNLNRSVIIRPDGRITFPPAGEITAAGLTTAKLASVLQTRLARTLNNARVQVLVKAANSRRSRIHVIGQVVKPGAYDLEEGLSPIGLVARAGGVISGAALRRVHVLRQSEQIPLDLEAALIDGRQVPEVQNFKFRSGDVLVIPENQSKVGVIGQVVKPAYYGLPEKPEDATVLKMIAIAGGQMPDADLAKIIVTRTENGGSRVIPVNVAASLTGITPDTLRLQANDVIYVPKLVNQVHVIGQVEKPGVYELKNGLTLLSALAEAGNPRPGARLSRAYVLRDGKQLPVDLHAAIVEGSADPAITQFALRPGDVVVIPENQMRFGVMGQVTKPGFYPFPESGKISALEALAQGGGQIPQGDNRGNIREAGVIRTVNGKPTVIPINFELVLKKGQVEQNIQLQPNDVVYVPAQKKGFKWTDVLGPLATLGVLF